MSEATRKSKWIRSVVVISAALLLVSSLIYTVGQLTGPGTSGADRPANNEQKNLPDFSVTSAGVSFSNPNPVEGDAVIIRAAVHNIGGLPTGVANVEFWDDVCEGCDGTYLIGMKQLGPIEPSGSRVGSLEWSTSGQRGDNVITVLIDYEDAVLESNGFNNIATRSIHVEGPTGPPVTVFVLSPYGGLELTGGTNHLIVWELIGDPQLLDVVIDYSKDGGTNWEIVHQGQYMSGWNSTLTYSWSVPLVDTTTALVRVCATDDVNVTTCGQSSGYFTIDSTRPRLIAFDPPDGATNVPIDYPINVYFNEPMGRVELGFTISPPFPVLYFQKHNSTWWTFILDPYEYNTTYTWGFTCAAKDDSQPGNSIEGCPLSYTFTTVSALKKPDLTLSSSDIFFSNGAPVEGQTINIIAHIHNVGLGDASNVIVRFQDKQPNNTTVIIGYFTIPFIGAGSMGNASVTWVAYPRGVHTIIVTADPSNTIDETDETNNEASRQITVSPPAPHTMSVHAVTFDNDKDGLYDDVIIYVYDNDGHAVEGAYVYIDGVFYARTPDMGFLIGYNFSLGTHQVTAEYGGDTVSTTFYSEGS